MNKSLLLVMCDVLVLAALSLSSGGFDENEDRSGGPYAGANAVADVTDAFATATNALAVAKKAKEAAERDAKDARDGEAKARAEAEKARAGQMDAEAKKNQSEVAAAAAEKAKEAAERVAEEAREGESKARVEAEKAQAGQMDAEAKKNQAEVAAAAAEEAKEAAERVAEEAREGESKARAEAAAERLKAQEIDETYGVPARAQKERIDRILKTARQVRVEFEKRKTDEFYSPVVDIDGVAYVFARYEGKTLNSVIKVTVNRSCTSHEAYYLKGSPDIVFFKLDNAAFPNKLTLGEKSEETLYYWISRKTGEGRRASLVPADLSRAVKDYAAIEPSDVLVDSGTASIVSMALSKGKVWDVFGAKGAYGFDQKIGCRHLHFWTEF